MTAPLPRSLYTGRKAVYRQGWEIIFIPVYEGTVNPLLTTPPPPGGGGCYLFQTHLRGGLIGNGGLFNLEKMMVPVLQKELQYNLEKLKYKKLRDHAAKEYNEIRTSSW